MICRWALKAIMELHLKLQIFFWKELLWKCMDVKYFFCSLGCSVRGPCVYWRVFAHNNKLQKSASYPSTTVFFNNCKDLFCQQLIVYCQWVLQHFCWEKLLQFSILACKEGGGKSYGNADSSTQCASIMWHSHCLVVSVHRHRKMYLQNWIIVLAIIWEHRLVLRSPITSCTFYAKTRGYSDD